MGSQVGHAVDALFPLNENGRVGNVKFFRGQNPEVTADQLAEQVLLANHQIESGTATRINNIDDGE